MKAPCKIKAVFVFFLTVSLLGRGGFPVLANNSIKNKSTDMPDYVVVCGSPVGIRLKSHGVIVTGFIGYTTENDEYVSPAKEAGIKEGDRIIGINGTPVCGIDDISMILDNSEQERMLISVENSYGNYEKEVILCRDSETNELKLGIWGRDSVSGIGTLTFYDEKTKIYGALGHPISDENEPYDISGGALKVAEITGIKKGCVGVPGELRGFFREEEPELGTVTKNCEMGIFGRMKDFSHISNSKEFCRLAVANNSEIRKGNAHIVTSAVDGSIKKYSIEITQINKDNPGGTKNFNIKVTDKQLIEATGGIVQGMSGSPVIQNGKLVGAVTHVLVNDPTRGYGIFIENMLEAAK